MDFFKCSLAVSDGEGGVTKRGAVRGGGEEREGRERRRRRRERVTDLMTASALICR